MGWRSHLLLLRRKTQRRVVGVLKGIEQGEFKYRQHGWLGVFRSQNGKEWDTTPKTATPKFNKGLVQVAVKEDRESDDEEEETVLPSYTQLLKSN